MNWIRWQGTGTYGLDEEMGTSECDTAAGTGKIGALKRITTNRVCA